MNNDGSTAAREKRRKLGRYKNLKWRTEPTRTMESSVWKAPADFPDVLKIQLMYADLFRKFCTVVVFHRLFLCKYLKIRGRFVKEYRHYGHMYMYICTYICRGGRRGQGGP
jgi:hypothetical protein